MSMIKIISPLILVCAMISSVPAIAKSKRGTESGGGGDASELRVNEIRADIYNWIKKGKAKKLILTNDLSYDDYESKMMNILEAQVVIVGFVEKDSRDDQELQVSVHGVPKTCRGFTSTKDLMPHMLCNISRFNKTSESELYKLIHHEYAGLAGIELNDGAASDYSISSQVTDVKKSNVVNLSADCMNNLNEVIQEKKKYLKSLRRGESDSSEIKITQVMNTKAETAALLCAGLKKLELEKSLSGKMGLISREKADDIGEETYNLAMEYYNSSSEK